MFGQVREDVGVERWLVSRHGAVGRAVVIASAGCTAISLLDLVSERLTAVDINPAQVEFVRWKVELMRRVELGKFRRELFDGRRARANSGIVDRILATLRWLLHVGVHSRGFVEDFLRMDSVPNQARRFDAEWDTWRWRLATEVAFNPLALRAGYGGEVARALPGSLAQLVRSRVRRTLTGFPANSNGYAWQSLAGRPGAGEAGLPYFAREAEYARLRARLGKLDFACADVAAWLRGQPAESIDFFGLSNVLELTGAERTRGLLREVERTARSGAVVCLRSILPVSATDPGWLVGRLRWDERASQEAERRDEGLVCNFFRILRAD